jgi:hypothetical protein
MSVEALLFRFPDGDAEFFVRSRRLPHMSILAIIWLYAVLRLCEIVKRRSVRGAPSTGCR